MFSELEKTILHLAVKQDLETDCPTEKQNIWKWALSLLRKFK